MKIVKVNKRDGVFDIEKGLLNAAYRKLEEASDAFDKVFVKTKELSNHSTGSAAAARFGQEIANSWIPDFKTQLKDIERTLEKIRYNTSAMG